MNLIVDSKVTTDTRELRAPFVTALRGVSRFEVIKFELKDSSGNWHCGETVETVKITGDSHMKIMLELTEFVPGLINGASIQDAISIIKRSELCSSAKAAVDMALHEALATGAKFGFSISTDVTIPIADIDDLPNLLSERVGAGFTNFKIKAHLEPVADLIAKLRVIREHAPSSAHFRIDANQAWTRSHTVNVINAIIKAGLEIDYLEQPTPARDFAALSEIRRNSPIKIMADESCFSLEDLLKLIELKAIDLVNLKLLKSGGLTVAREMAKVAQSAGIQTYVGSMMEGDQSLRAAATLANEIAPDLVHDLDASWWAKESQIAYRNGKVYL